MRLHEFDQNLINEIEKLKRGDFLGGKQYLKNFQGLDKSTFKQLPGPSGYLYSVTFKEYGMEIRVYDPSKQQSPDLDFPLIIGKLSLDNIKFPLPNSVEVDTITTHEDYRGMGIAKALYGIALSILKKTLVSGSSQTPAGRRNWVSLNKIPGVEVKGYVRIPKGYFRLPDSNIENEEVIDTLMGKLGAEYLGMAANIYTGDNYFFSFDVRPNRSETEMRAMVNTALSDLYGNKNFLIVKTGMYATFNG